MLLKDKVAIVTGGAQGLGRAFSHTLASEGAKLVVADINGKGALGVAEEIRGKGGEALGFEVDVSVEESTRRMADACVGRYGGVDVLVNNAAIYYGLKYTPFEELSSEEWDRVMAVNVKGIWLCTKAVAPYMKDKKKGKIINIASGAPLKGNPGLLHYNASKSAVIGMTRSLAKEMGKHGINVNAVAPSITMTDASKLLAGEERLKQALSGRCFQRFEEPEDIVGTVVFLASNLSDYITGQTIAVNGGDLFL